MIYINARFLTQPVTGVQRFAIEISRQLKAVFKDEIQFLSPTNIVHYDIAHSLETITIGKYSGHYWEQVELPKYLKRVGTPLLINLGSTAPIYYKNQIVTHHDITYIRHPESFSKQFKLLYKIIVPRMLKNSKKVITVSNFSKDEIAQHFKISEEKIEVIYNGIDFCQFNIGVKNDKMPDGIIVGKYILAVSSKNIHKNFHGLIEAFHQLKGIPNISLVIVGASNIGSFNQIDVGDILEKDDRIRFLGRIDDDTLTTLYQNTLAFVFPSFYEGFGIPPLEAQACGAPVLASKIASIPEILKDSALYFNPYDIADMAQKIQKSVIDENLREFLIAKGLENVKNYTWSSSAQKLIQVIRQFI